MATGQKPHNTKFYDLALTEDKGLNVIDKRGDSFLGQGVQTGVGG